MFFKMFSALCILTVAVVIKSALATCPPLESQRFGECGPSGRVANANGWRRCRFRGDPHIITFDRNRPIQEYRFGDEGNFTAVDQCNDEDDDTEGDSGAQIDLKIYVSMEARLKNSSQFRVHCVAILKGGIFYKFYWRKSDPLLVIGDSSVNIGQDSYQNGLAIFVRKNSREFVFRCEDVKIIIDCRYNIVTIWLRRSIFGDQDLCGLCGNFNGEPDDDTECDENCPDEDCDDNDKDCSIPEFGALWKQNGNGGGNSGGDDNSDDDNR